MWTNAKMLPLQNFRLNFITVCTYNINLQGAGGWGAKKIQNKSNFSVPRANVSLPSEHEAAAVHGTRGWGAARGPRKFDRSICSGTAGAHGGPSPPSRRTGQRGAAPPAAPSAPKHRGQSRSPPRPAPAAFGDPERPSGLASTPRSERPPRVRSSAQAATPGAHTGGTPVGAGDPRGPRPPSRRAAGRAGRGAAARASPARSPVRVLRVRGSDRGGGGDGCRRWLARSLMPCWASAAPADVCLPISGLGRKGGEKKKFHLNLNKKTFNMKSHSGNGHGP